MEDYPYYFIPAKEGDVWGAMPVNKDRLSLVDSYIERPKSEDIVEGYSEYIKWDGPPTLFDLTISFLNEIGLTEASYTLEPGGHLTFVKPLVEKFHIPDREYEPRAEQGIVDYLRLVSR